MTTSTEALKDWISYAYDQEAKHLFVIKPYDSTAIYPRFVSKKENVELVRNSILQGGEEIEAELNMEVKLLFLNAIK